jgi:hypothetical protein
MNDLLRLVNHPLRGNVVGIPASQNPNTPEGLESRLCSHKNLMAHMEQSKALSRKAKPIVFLFKATKTSETTN